MKRLARVTRYAETVRHMKARQITSRIRLRALRQAMAAKPKFFEQRWTLPALPATPGWPAGFAPLDSERFNSAERADEIERLEFELLNERVIIGTDWHNVSATQLWRFHLHYWDWCWHVANHRDSNELATTFSSMYRDWAASTTYGKLDAWSPYVVSLRLWTWCGLHGRLEADSPARQTIESEVRRHAGFLRRNLETDVGGNHLLKNLKAMIGAAVFLDDDSMLAAFVARIEAQVSIQILDDGGHYELSPSYHAQVLGDVLDIRALLVAAGKKAPESLDGAITKMRTWLSEMVGPDGEVPVFNDAFAIDTDELVRLGVPEHDGSKLVVLEASGYVIVRPRPDVQVAIDVGHPCPPDLPAHAHADCLSFELVIGDERVIVDTGTSEYGSTERRQFERSTAAHNTVEIDGTNQTDVWGAFRAGRRARPELIRASVGETTKILVEAEHDGYRGLPRGSATHHRRFEISPTEIAIVDTAHGNGSHDLVSTLRCRGQVVATAENPRQVELRCQNSKLRITGTRIIAVSATATHAREMGVVAPASTATMSASGELPVTLRWSIGWN